MDTPPPPYSEKDPIYPDPPSYTEKDIEQLLRRKLSRKARLDSLPPPPTPPTTPPPRQRKTKRDRWWFVCPPTFGRTHKECAIWHMYILVGIACFFLWLSVAAPNYLEAKHDKDFDKNDRAMVSNITLVLGVFALPFALFGSLGLKYTLQPFLILVPAYYGFWMTFFLGPVVGFPMIFVQGIVWADFTQVCYSAVASIVTIIIFWYLSHGYRTFMRVRNDMKDDYLDAHPELIVDFEESEVSEVSEVSECETLSQSE